MCRRRSHWLRVRNGARASTAENTEGQGLEPNCAHETWERNVLSLVGQIRHEFSAFRAGERRLEEEDAFARFMDNRRPRYGSDEEGRLS